MFSLTKTRRPQTGEAAEEAKHSLVSKFSILRGGSQSAGIKREIVGEKIEEEANNQSQKVVVIKEKKLV